MRALAILTLLAACHGFDPPGQVVESAHPLSNAGTGSFYPLGTTVTLDGSRSSAPHDTPLTYSWSVVQRPIGSTAAPVDPGAATTSFVLDQLGTFWFRLVVSDDAGNSDSSDLRIVSTGAITGIDAGPDATVSWLDTVQLAGAVSTVPGKTVTYSWSFVSQPTGSTTVIQNGDTLRPTLFADAAGTYVLALDATVGDEVREDTVSIDVNGDVGVPLGTGVVAYTYSTYLDRIIYVHDVGHAEVVEVNPATGGAQAALDVGAFTPRSIAVDPTGEYVAIAGLGKIAAIDLQHFTLWSQNDVPGCTAKHVAIPNLVRVDCFPADGSIEPISSVNLTTGAVTQIACPVKYPDIALSGGALYMVDGASPQFYSFEDDPLLVIAHVSHAGIAPPVIAINTSFPSAITGNGLALDADSGSLLYDLQMPVSAGASQKGANGELALVSGSVLKVFQTAASGPPPLKLSAVLPPVNGTPPTTKLVAYSADGHRLIVVAGTTGGDVAYTVPR
jgi:hypothetical protein